MDIEVHFSEMDFFVHIKNVSMIFMDSYIGRAHLGEMDFFVNLSRMDFTVKTYPTFATYMCHRLWYWREMYPS